MRKSTIEEMGVSENCTGQKSSTCKLNIHTNKLNAYTCRPPPPHLHRHEESAGCIEYAKELW
jgi:hypothetical protein